VSRFRSEEGEVAPVRHLREAATDVRSGDEEGREAGRRRLREPGARVFGAALPECVLDLQRHPHDCRRGPPVQPEACGHEAEQPPRHGQHEHGIAGEDLPGLAPPPREAEEEHHEDRSAGVGLELGGQRRGHRDAAEHEVRVREALHQEVPRVAGEEGSQHHTTRKAHEQPRARAWPARQEEAKGGEGEEVPARVDPRREAEGHRGRDPHRPAWTVGGVERRPAQAEQSEHGHRHLERPSEKEPPEHGRLGEGHRGQGQEEGLGAAKQDQRGQAERHEEADHREQHERVGRGAGHLVHEAQERVPARVAVHLEVGSQDEDVGPRLARHGFAGVTQGVVRGQVALAQEAQRNQERHREGEAPDREGEVPHLGGHYPPSGVTVKVRARQARYQAALRPDRRISREKNTHPGHDRRAEPCPAGPTRSNLRTMLRRPFT